MRLGVLLSFAILGCVSVDVPAELPCSLGGQCPPGYQCDGADLVCRVPGGACGDGTRNVGERCDDGNQTSGDECRSDCAGIEICGDSQTDVDEACDDGNEIEGDGCDSNCTTSACGNGITAADEVCDDSNATSGDGCRADCKKVELCSDGQLDQGEVCDDGNFTGADRCRADCQGTEVCGDGLVDVDEACDGGATCLTACEFSTCNDGTASPGEICLARQREFVPPTIGSVIPDVASGDIDGDAHTDLLWLRGTQILVRRGTGGGNFPTETSFATTLASKIRLADLDTDGDLDLIGITQDSVVAYHLNDGTGTFGGAIRLELHADGVTTVDVGDFDSDGDNDIVVSSNEPRLYRNNGSLSFTVSFVFPPPFGGRVLAVGDVDGDEDLDILFDTNRGTVHRNDGTGLFTNFTVLGATTTNGAFAGAFGDVDGDGDLDVVIASVGLIREFTNTGGGAYAPEVTFPNGTGDRDIAPGGLAVGDLDNDGDVDIVLAANRDLRVLRNTGVGVFGGAESYGARNPDLVRLGDFDDDGDLDIATTSVFFRSGSVTFNNAGQIGAARTFNRLPDALHLATLAGDFNGDDSIDLVFSNVETANISLLLGNGQGAFPTSTTAQLPANRVPLAIAAGKFDADQDLDLVALSVSSGAGKLTTFTNSGTGTLTSSGEIDLGLTTTFTTAIPVSAGLALGDLDEDGTLDLVAAIPGGERIATLRGNGTGSFGALTTFELDPGQATRIVRVALGDLDGDGHLDLVITNDHPLNPAVLIMRGDGHGTLGLPERQPMTFNTDQLDLMRGLAVVDSDGDGDLDVVFGRVGSNDANNPNGIIMSLINDGAGHTPTFTLLDFVGDLPSAMAIGDVDNNGNSDFVIVNGTFPHVSVTRTSGASPVPPFRLASNFETFGSSVVSSAPALADFNNDGAPDVAWADGGFLFVAMATP